MRTSHLFMLALLGAAIGLVACGSSEEEAPAAPPEPPPVLLEALPTPEVNMTKVLLGRRLFHDGRLSGDGSVSCSTCHSLDHGGAEPRPTSIGIGAAVGPINSPTVLNSSLNFVQFWDGRAATLEDQARGPVANPLEMGSDFNRVLANLSGEPTYVTEFAGLYPDGITEANIVDAIAEYERSLITPGRFDRFIAGDPSALTAEERAGYELFTTVGCTSCHRGPNIGGTMYQKMGLVRDYFAARGTPLTEADNGRYNVTHDEADRHFFKVPTLRNVALTAPYLHDGTQATLPDVVRVMGLYQLGRELTDEQVTQLVAFLGSLTGELPEHARMPADPTPGEAIVPPTGDVTTPPGTTGPGVHAVPDPGATPTAPSPPAAPLTDSLGAPAAGS